MIPYSLTDQYSWSIIKLIQLLVIPPEHIEFEPSIIAKDAYVAQALTDSMRMYES